MSVYETPLWIEVEKRLKGPRGKDSEKSNYQFEIEPRGPNLVLIIQKDSEIFGSFDFPSTPEGKESLVKWLTHLLQFPESSWKQGLKR